MCLNILLRGDGGLQYNVQRASILSTFFGVPTVLHYIIWLHKILRTLESTPQLHAHCMAGNDDSLLYSCRLVPGVVSMSSTVSTLRCCQWWRSRSSPSSRPCRMRPSGSSLRAGRSNSPPPVASSSP